MPTITLVARDGAEAPNLESAAWVYIHGTPNEPLNLTVRHTFDAITHCPSSTWLEALPRQQGDPHPDDSHFHWPSLGLIG